MRLEFLCTLLQGPHFASLPQDVPFYRFVQHCVSFANTSRLNMFREEIAVYFESNRQKSTLREGKLQKILMLK